MGGLLAKPETTKHVQDGMGSSGQWAYGVSDMQGWRPGMEDAHLALPDFDVDRQLGLFGVFDGHGGAAVAKIAAERLPDTLRALPSFKEGRYHDALYEAFLKVDAFLDSAEGRKLVVQTQAKVPKPSTPDPDDLEAMLENADEEEEEEIIKKMLGTEGEDEGGEEEDEEDDDEESDGNAAWSNGEGPDGQGATAVVALIRRGTTPEVLVANAGDSRCVLVRGPKALAMSYDHKPANKIEKQRILKAGGFITSEGRVDGNLNLSRALGDFAYKKDKCLTPQEQKISCEPDVKRRDIQAEDRFLLLGCDGIFEKASNQALVDFMLPVLPSSAGTSRSSGRQRTLQSQSPPLSQSCSAFLDHNIAKNPAKEQGLGCDNMTLMVVDLLSGNTIDASTARTASADLLNGECPRGKRKSAMLPFGGRGGGVRRLIGKKSVGPSAGRRRLIMWARQRSKSAKM